MLVLKINFKKIKKYITLIYFQIKNNFLKKPIITILSNTPLTLAPFKNSCEN